VALAVCRHHQPAEPGDTATLADVVHVADSVAHALDLSRVPGEAVPEIGMQAWNRLGLEADRWLTIFRDVEEGVGALCQALDI